MSLKPIITLPDPVLRQVSKPVERIDDDLQRLLDDMLETMYDAPGIGLAGIQVGVPLRVITVDVARRRGREDGGREDGEGEAGEAATDDGATDAANEAEEEVRDPLFLINPKIVRLGDEPSVYEEGCLSIPDYYAEVERPGSVTVSYLDREGKERLIEADGILSTCLQHEIDHLEGKLFIDYLSRLKRDMVIKKFTKAAKQDGKPAAGNGRRMVG